MIDARCQATEQPIALLAGESSLIPPQRQASMLVGSCIGLFMHDPLTRISAAAHVALPENLGAEAVGNPSGPLGKYADSAPSHLRRLLDDAGCDTNRLIVKLAGAACMYGLPTHDTVGEMNLDRLHRSLQSLGVSPQSSHVRGRWARQLKFNSRDGSLRVTLVAGKTVEI